VAEPGADRPLERRAAAPVIISAALTGGLPVPREHPHFPDTPERIGEDAVAAWRAGAAIVHIHARDDAGEPRWEAELFARTLKVIRDAGSDVVVNLTTSWGGRDPDIRDEVRFAPLTLRPDLASFDCGSTNFDEGVFLNSKPFLRRLAAAMLEAGVKPEIEIFDAGMIETAIELRDAGLLQPPLFFQFVLGVPGGAPATPKHLMHLLDCLPADALWSVCAVGRGQLPMNALGLVNGGNVRTGLEDNLMFARGVPASNEALVKRVRELVELLNLPVATPSQARDLLGLGDAARATAS
jgi:3-keto-5-aminohexanoate cleavage enzyme